MDPAAVREGEDNVRGSGSTADTPRKTLQTEACRTRLLIRERAAREQPAREQPPPEQPVRGPRRPVTRKGPQANRLGSF